MLFKTLDAIRRKPKHVRQQYSLGAATVFMAVVVSIWVWSLPERFSEVSGSVEDVQSAGVPFSHLFKQIKDQFTGPLSVSNESEVAPVPMEELRSALEMFASPEATTSTSTIDARTGTSSGRVIMIATTSNSATTTQ